MSRTRLVVVDMPASRLDDDVLMDPTDLLWDDGELRVGRDVMFAEEAPTSDELAARLRDLVARRGQTLAGITRYQDKDLWIVTVEVGLTTRGKTVASALEFADEVEAVVTGSLDDVATVATLVKAGHAHLLIGSYESDWLEAKSAPYRDVPADEIELAKDVAAYANGNGGLLLIGLKTKRDGRGDRIRTVNECTLDAATLNRYQRVIKKHVYPAVERLAITAVPGTSTSLGVILIEVPAQAEGSKPFLVHGVVRDGQVEGAYLGVPVRAGADTEFLDIRVLHSRLRAGTAYLAGTIQEPDVLNTGLPDHSAESQARPASPQHASVAEFLHEAVSAATRHGFAIERARGSIAFRSSRGEVVVAPSDPAGPLADQNARETLLDSLSRVGLPVRRTESGFLVPER
jgi:Schlafen, AlbA_2